VIVSPPSESRNQSLKAIGIPDIYGTNRRPQQLAQLHEMEKTDINNLMIILSDVQCDKPSVSCTHN